MTAPCDTRAPNRFAGMIVNAFDGLPAECEKRPPVMGIAPPPASVPWLRHRVKLRALPGAEYKTMFTFPNIMFPGAGGNWQEIMTRWWSPNISLNFAGDAGIEREVNEDVASYGRQIGWLNEIVEALAAAAPDALKANADAEGSLKKLKAAQQKIAEIKARRQANALDKARAALSALDKDDYRRLLRSLDPEQPPDTN